LTGKDKTALAQARAQIKRLRVQLENGHEGKRDEFGRTLREAIKRWQATETEILKRYGKDRRK
jgi:hypothetical protein